MDFFNEVNAGVLPAVSFVKPLYDEHPSYTTETESEDHTVTILNSLVASPLFASTLILVTYDEKGERPTTSPRPRRTSGGPGRASR
jgi:phospholipase C